MGVAALMALSMGTLLVMPSGLLQQENDFSIQASAVFFGVRLKPSFQRLREPNPSRGDVSLSHVKCSEWLHRVARKRDYTV